MIGNNVFENYFFNLSNAATPNDIMFTSDNISCKYTIDLKLYYIEIYYEYMDNFYRIKVEDKNACEILFLTKSKAFKKDVKKAICKNKLNDHDLKSHINVFCLLFKSVIDNQETFVCLKERYKENLKFDGIFL